MSVRRTVWTALVMVVMGGGTAQAIEVQGAIASDTVWTLANNPYIVTGAITVDSGATLTIEPGVSVLFDVDVPIIVNGRLLAVGTESAKILFSISLALEWGGLSFIDSDSNLIHHATISHASSEASGTIDLISGGGIYLQNSMLGLKSTTISGNKAISIGSKGGGICLIGSQVSMENCNVTGNWINRVGSNVDLRGGGIYLGGGSTLSMYGSSITSNSIWDYNNPSGYGGGIYVAGSTLLMDSCAVGGNSARHGGGLNANGVSDVDIHRSNFGSNSGSYGSGIFIGGASTVGLRRSDVTGNTGIYGVGLYMEVSSTLNASLTNFNNNYSGSRAAQGVGLLISGSTANIDSSFIENNWVGTNGIGAGIRIAGASQVSMNSVSISGNYMTQYDGPRGIGGGLSIDDNSDVYLTKCIITANNTASAAGVWIDGVSGLTLDRCTMITNVATTNSAIFIGANANNVNLVNTILWQDTFTSGFSASYSIIDGDTVVAGIGNSNTNPLFVDFPAGNYARHGTSPAIDAGDPATELDPDAEHVRTLVMPSMLSQGLE